MVPYQHALTIVLCPVSAGAPVKYTENKQASGIVGIIEGASKAASPLVYSRTY